MKLIPQAVLLLVCLWRCDALNCEPGICNRVDCFPVTKLECKGVFIEKGGPCGCCDACFDVIEPGQSCQRWSSNNPPKALCKDGYWCNNGICTPYLGR